MHESLRESTPKRPGASECMHRAHKGATYEEWFRGRVEASRSDPRPSIANDDMKAEFAKRRAALWAKITCTNRAIL